MITIREAAKRLGLKKINSNGELEYIGPNPFESGATEDGFAIFGTGDYAGSGYDRKSGETYSSYKVAELLGVPYEEYEGSLSHPKKYVAADFDNRSFQERGLAKAAMKNFGVEYRTEEDGWGPSYIWPTYSYTGKKMRSRVRFRYPERQVKFNGGKKPSKTIWDNGTKSLGMPDAFGLNLTEGVSDVWLVNSELAVMLFWQEGVTAISLFSESRKIESLRLVFSRLKAQGCQCIHILPDNDAAGYKGACLARDAALVEELEPIVYSFEGCAEKFDASELYLAWKNNLQIPDHTFLDCLLEQNVIESDKLESWREGVTKAAAAKEVAEQWKDTPAKPTLALQFEGLRLCPECAARSVIHKSDGKDGWICWLKAGGCGKDFDEKDRAITHQKISTKKQQNDTVMRSIIEGHEMFWTASQATYIIVERDGVMGAMDIEGKEFARWCDFQYQEHTGKFPTKNIISQTQHGMASYCRHKHEKRELHVRSAMVGDVLYIDLANDKQECVEIDSEGWRIVTSPTVYFTRPFAMQEMVRPEKPKDAAHTKEIWDKFRDIFSIESDQNWMLIVGWMISALVPGKWPCPALSVHGEMGSGKTTLCNNIRQLLDPSMVPATTEPQDRKDVIIPAETRRIYGLENIRKIEPWLSDLLSAMITGSTVEVRELFTDSGLRIFKSQPAVIINGIPEKFGGADLGDRCLNIHLPSLSQKGWKLLNEIEDDFKAFSPLILGAIFDAMHTGFKNKAYNPEIASPKKFEFPRMNHFSHWVTLCEESLPWHCKERPVGYFNDVYRNNIIRASAAELENIFAQSLIALYKRIGNFIMTSSELRMAMLHEASVIMADKDKLAEIENDVNMIVRHREKAKNHLYDVAKMQVIQSRQFPADSDGLNIRIAQICPALRKVHHIDCSRSTDGETRGNAWVVRGPAAPDDGWKREEAPKAQMEMDY